MLVALLAIFLSRSENKKASAQPQAKRPGWADAVVLPVRPWTSDEFVYFGGIAVDPLPYALQELCQLLKRAFYRGKQRKNAGLRGAKQNGALRCCGAPCTLSVRSGGASLTGGGQCGGDHFIDFAADVGQDARHHRELLAGLPGTRRHDAGVEGHHARLAVDGFNIGNHAA